MRYARIARAVQAQRVLQAPELAVRIARALGELGLDEAVRCGQPEESGGGSELSAGG